MSLETVPRPDSFYKFMSVGTETQMDRVRDTLIKQELWMPESRRFNDPFDCHLRISFEASKKEIVAYYTGILKTRRPGSKNEELKGEVLKRYESLPIHTTEHQNRMRTEIQSRTDGLGVVSLSGTRDPILMWSHYADSHRGLCLGFKSVSSEDAFDYCKQVKYRSAFPVIHVFVDPESVVYEKAVLSKSSDWRYEEEWRIVNNERGDVLVPFDPENLTSVTLGCRMNDRCVELVRSWVRECPSEPDVYKAVMCEDEYSLRFEEA